MQQDFSAANCAQEISAVEIARFAMEFAPQLLEVLENLIRSQNQLLAKLEQLNQKLDQHFVREIHSAFQTISSIGRLSSEGLKERHLIVAEGNLLKYVALDPGQSTAGLSNESWMARGYFGLSSVASIRNETADASYFLLQAFAAGPRESRTNLAVEFYETFFLPHCADLLKKFNDDMAALPPSLQRAEELKGKIRWEQVGQVGFAALGIGMWVLSGGKVPPQSSMHAARASSVRAPVLKELQDELAALPTEQSIRTEYELGIDIRCRTLAQELLRRTDSKN